MDLYVIKEAQASLEAELPNLKWETADAMALMTHFTGRGPTWVVQLVCLGADLKGRIEMMGAATRGNLVLKLTDEQCGKAEFYARDRGPK